MSEIDTSYYKTEEWFRSLEWQRPWIERLAAWWVGTYGRQKQVLDLGAGDGWWGKAFHDLGSEVLAVELYDEARQYMPDCVSFYRHDLTQPGDFYRAYDLVICLEVAEHLPRPAAGVLAMNVARHAGGHILFSSAGPGQQGTGHINLQPPKYWRDLFGGYKCELNAKMTGETQVAFTNILQTTAFDFLPKNIQVFSRI